MFAAQRAPSRIPICAIGSAGDAAFREPRKLGLGSYGKTLTVLSSEVFADEEDEDQDLEERWTARFQR
jgi:hypothetical protein